MKVIFLDVDGVLNSEKDLLEAKGKSELYHQRGELVVQKVVVIRGMERKSSKHLQIDWQNIRWKYMILHQS